MNNTDFLILLIGFSFLYASFLYFLGSKKRKRQGEYTYGIKKWILRIIIFSTFIIGLALVVFSIYIFFIYE